MKRIALFGSTGSIGVSTLEVVRRHSDALKVVALASHSDIETLEKQIAEFAPKIVCVFDHKKAAELKQRVSSTKIVAGREGLEEMAAFEESDLVVMAIVGKEALRPTVRAIESGKAIALATKEVLVAGGSWLTSLAKENRVPLIPIDSEHNAIFQAVQKEDMSKVRRIILTASGGPFRQYSLDELERVTIEEALRHPTWNMGKKITIDSSTLMNKSLEMIEAHYLFGIDPKKIEVVIHPQSIVHSFVEFIDGTLLAVMNDPNMINPIQYALTFPERRENILPFYDFAKHQSLEFFTPDFVKFPTLRFAYEVMEEGKSYPCFFNAANDVLVARFLNREIPWKGIMDRLEKLLEAHQPMVVDALENILDIDEAAREAALRV